MTYDNHEPFSMARWILKSKMPLSLDESRMVERAMDPEPGLWPVSDLHLLNMLCVMCEGFGRRARAE